MARAACQDHAPASAQLQAQPVPVLSGTRCDRWRPLRSLHQEIANGIRAAGLKREDAECSGHAFALVSPQGETCKTDSAGKPVGPAN